jgi:exodeoxyribonuclease-3
MKIATWNVNSVGRRKARLLAWLAASQPNVVCLQELKAVDDDFPQADLTAAGYRTACAPPRSIARCARANSPRITRRYGPRSPRHDSISCAIRREIAPRNCTPIPTG